MHKAVILLVEAKNEREASSKSCEFMERYRDNVWDWYCIGGRWTGTLSKYDPYTDPDNKETCFLCGGTGLRNDNLGRAERLKNPKYGCNGCGEYSEKNGCIGKGSGLQLKSASKFKDIGNILPLKDCLDVVKKWQQTEKDGLKRLEDAKRWLKPENDKDDYSMYGYCVSIAGEILKQEFSFDTNVFNIENDDFSIPKDIEKFYAVVIDMHN